LPGIDRVSPEGAIEFVEDSIETLGTGLVRKAFDVFLALWGLRA